jgi:hypothetical protein
LWRPWSGLVVAGWKRVENRTWSTTYRGPVYIHAGRQWDPGGAIMALQHKVCDGDWLGTDWYLTRGGYVGTVHLVDVHPATDVCCQPWGEPARLAGPPVYHWVCTDPHRFPEPIPGRGLQRLYRVPPAVLAAHPPQ